MIVDLETVKGHLRLDSDDADDILVRKIEQAEALVENYLKTDISVWDPESDDFEEDMPPEVEAAVFLVVEALFDGADPLSDTVKSLLHSRRDPTLA